MYAQISYARTCLACLVNFTPHWTTLMNYTTHIVAKSRN